MTGPEHFKEAERLLADARVPGEKRSVRNFFPVETLMAVAQVHATLALAAATALVNPAGGLPGRDHEAWFRAAGTPGPAAAAS